MKEVKKLEKLEMIRNKKGYSCQFMANHLKISKSYYWQIENKKRRLSYDLALKIADIFKTTPDVLFYDELRNREA